MPRNHLSSLVNEQTTVQIDSQPSFGAILRRSCEPQYAAAFRLYSILDLADKKFRAQRLRDCRSNAWFTRHVDTGEVRVASSSCSLRWCPVCSNCRRNYLTREVGDWVGTADHPKLITLTLKHTHAPLDHQVTHLYNFFRELRRRKDFRDAVTGGVWFFQIKKSKKDGLWHPHIHALITGKYLPHRRLRRMWIQITYGSEIVDIRPVRDPVKVASDVARYATSPGSLVNLAPDDAIEMYEALHSRRICGTWGHARGISLRPKLDGEKGKWKPIGSWSIVMGMYNSSADARAIVLSWKTGAVLPEGISVNNIEEAIDKITSGAWHDYNFESVYDHERSPP